MSTIYCLLMGLVGLGVLSYNLFTAQQEPAWLPVLIFAVLSLFVQRSSFHLGSSVMHSLAGVVDVAAVLALGPLGGALVAVLSGTTYLELTAVRRRRLTRYYLVEIPLFNAGLKALMALFGGMVYLAMGGVLPLSSLGAKDTLAALALCLVWFVVDHVGWGIRDYLEGGRKQLGRFVQDIFSQALLIELLPLPFGLVVALVFNRLDWIAFGLLVMFMVTVALLAQRWADTRNELLQRVNELSTIEQSARTIAQAELNVDELCKLMYECANQIADATIFHLGLFDGDDYTLRFWVREGEPIPQRTFHLAPRVGLVNWLRESKQPLLVRDFSKDLDSLPARPAYVSEDPPRSAIYVPLIAGDVVIGTMSVQSFRRNAYGDSDLRVLSAMANQAAIALQKAQLYEREHERACQLETIGQVSRQVTATLELDELFKRVVRLIRENFGYYHIAIYTADREREVVAFQASSSAGQHDVAFGVEWGQGLIGWVAANGQPVVVNDVEHDERYRCVEALDETNSELTIPLLLEDELVGVLDVQSDRVGAFDSDDLFILETLGVQIAIAIQEARLYEAERQQAWLSTALLQVADSMSQVSDLDAVLTSIVRLTPILAGVDRCAILLWSKEAETFTPAQTYGLSSELREAFESMVFQTGDVPALDLVRYDRHPLLVDVTRDGMLFPQSLVQTFDIHEAVLLPLLAGGELLGAMMVDYAGKPHHFSERVIGMLTGIANQAAMVIHSARLVQARQEEAYVSMALLQVAEAVNRATDLQETLATIVRITPILVGVEACAIFLWDPGVAAFLPSQQYGLEKEERVAFERSRLDEGDPLVHQLMMDGSAVALRDLVAPTAIVSLWDQESVLAIPMLTKGEMLGIMSVGFTVSPRRFSERWMSILNGIAGQAALAVENDRLLQEATEQQRMKQELAMAQRIQASFLPESCPSVPGWELAAIWRSARQVGGDFYDFIPLPSGLRKDGTKEERHGLVIADVADKGVPAALFMALSRTLVRTMAIDGRPPARAISLANDLIVADARSDLFVTLFYAILRAESGEITFVNAGHVPSLVVRAANGEVEELRAPGIALGILPGMDFEEHGVHLERGDTLVLYTDGVTEAIDADGQMFGRERLRQVVSRYRERQARELAETIDRAVTAFVGDAPQFDDFTLVLVKRTG